MDLSSFDYNLPQELIAQYPIPRGTERLLVAERLLGSIRHETFSGLLSYLEKGDCLVFNDTKVIPARLIGKKSTGGAVEFLVLKKLGDRLYRCMVGSSKPLRKDQIVIIDKDVEARVIDRDEEFFLVEFNKENIVETCGHIPLPPYISRAADGNDTLAYQTVYAKNDGSVAAPTAGLHFTRQLVDEIASKGIDMVYITLHVGPGTFKPVKTERVEEHKMHKEEFEVSETAANAINKAMIDGRRVIAVGTTVVRVLEHLMMTTGKISDTKGETAIFIYPGFVFRCVKALVTNFHLPRSTLLMLACAYGGYDLMIKAYNEAIKEKYRFFSYGDAMLII